VGTNNPRYRSGDDAFREPRRAEQSQLFLFPRHADDADERQHGRHVGPDHGRADHARPPVRILDERFRLDILEPAELEPAELEPAERKHRYLGQHGHYGRYDVFHDGTDDHDVHDDHDGSSDDGQRLRQQRVEELLEPEVLQPEALRVLGEEAGEGVGEDGDDRNYGRDRNDVIEHRASPPRHALDDDHAPALSRISKATKKPPSEGASSCLF